LKFLPFTINEFYEERIIRERQRKKAPKGISESPGAFILDPSAKSFSCDTTED
jgi:hypothetical protein